MAVWTFSLICSPIWPNVADIISDGALAMGYYFLGDWWWFGLLTLTFTIVPSLVITTFSLVCHYKDRRHYEPYIKLEWAAILLAHVFQIGPFSRWFFTSFLSPLKLCDMNSTARWNSMSMVISTSFPFFRYSDTMFYGVRSRLTINSKNPQDARKRQYDRMLHENTHACRLHLSSSFSSTSWLALEMRRPPPCVSLRYWKKIFAFLQIEMA